MLKKPRSALLAILLACGLATCAARADISYKYTADQSSYSLVGGTASAKIYLSEILTAPSSSLITSDGGLDGAAFSISVESGSGVKISGINFNPAFDAGSPINHSTFSNTSASLSESTNFGSPGVGLDGSGLGAFLGTLTFADSGGGTVKFDVARLNNLGGNTITRAGNDLDFNSTNPAYTGASLGTFTVTSAVPEPSCLGFLLAASGLMLRRRCRASNI